MECGGPGGRRNREEDEMGIDSSSAEKQQLAQGNRGKTGRKEERVID